MNISRILKFLTWHGFDEFGWNDPKVVKTKNRRIMPSLKCAVCDSKKIIKEQEARGLLSSLGIKTPLTKIPLVGALLFL